MPAPVRLFPFDDAIAFGIGILRLPPQQFWSMTPRELRAATKPYRKDSSRSIITRDALFDLMNAFPDNT